jgi:hypothetical protein
MFAASLAPDLLVQTRILSEAIQINRSFLVPSAFVGVYIISLTFKAGHVGRMSTGIIDLISILIVRSKQIFCSISTHCHE